jgi:hypothetical protein
MASTVGSRKTRLCGAWVGACSRRVSECTSTTRIGALERSGRCAASASKAGCAPGDAGPRDGAVWAGAGALTHLKPGWSRPVLEEVRRSLAATRTKPRGHHSGPFVSCQIGHWHPQGGQQERLHEYQLPGGGLALAILFHRSGGRECSRARPCQTAVLGSERQMGLVLA